MRLTWRIWAATVVSSILIVVGLGTVTAAPAEAWVIGHPGLYNMGTVGTGVSRWPGYDAILPVGRSTYGYLGWSEAKGFYTGAGWCTNYYFSNGYDYIYRWTVRGPVESSIPWLQDGGIYSYLC
jgi:hypothetical protein